jgi:hypothetical protein
MVSSFVKADAWTAALSPDSENGKSTDMNQGFHETLWMMRRHSVSFYSVLVQFPGEVCAATRFPCSLWHCDPYISLAYGNRFCLYIPDGRAAFLCR